jgi:folate-dependent phosphoribosylglycinamide formyltransferase PurN
MFILFIKNSVFNEVIIKVFNDLLKDKNKKVITSNFNKFLSKNQRSVYVLFNFQEKIISANYLKNIKYPINFHPGTRYFPGRGCYSWAIYKNTKVYGSTAHIMSPKVDTGKIIEEETFKVEKNETIETLKFKTFISSLNLFFKILLKFANNEKITFHNIKWARKPYRINDLNKINLIKRGMSKKKIDKIIRSTTYYPFGPYEIKHGKKIQIKIKKKTNLI